MKLIDKDKALELIDKKLSYYKDLENRGLLNKEGDAAFRTVRILKSDINTLEVKEVDLEKEIQEEYNPIDGLSFEEYSSIAKHFFELGLKLGKENKL